MNIENWLSLFSEGWSNHDINKVLSLFAKDVEYWETPDKLLGAFDNLEEEWKGILGQKNIELTTKVYSSAGSKHSVIWHLQYVNSNEQVCKWSGTYLISLSDIGLCNYFHHTGERLA